MSTSISATEIGLPDNAKLKLGTGEDLEIYHDGTNTYLDNNTGQFNIDAASGNAIRFLVNGSYQCQVYTSGIDLPDNKKLRLGDSEDLQIYHNGTNSYVRNSTGQLLVGGSGGDLVLEALGDVRTVTWEGENMIYAKRNGAVELYYDNSKKLETTTDGGKVTGELDVFKSGTGDVFHVQGNGTGAVVAKIENAYNSDNDRFAILELKSGKGSIRFNSNGDSNEGAITYEMATNAMVFGVNNAQEKMRIDASGRMLIGTSISDSPATSGKLQMGINGTSGNAACFFDYGGYNTGILYMQHARAGANNNAFSGIMIDFRNKNNSQVGKIHADVGATMYATSSDYRLKENVVAISDGITRLKTLKPSRFNWKEDKNRTIDGFLAHEVTAVPEAISGVKDGVDEDGNPEYQAIDQSKLVPLLVAAVQELAAKVEALEAA